MLRTDDFFKVPSATREVDMPQCRPSRKESYTQAQPASWEHRSPTGVVGCGSPAQGEVREGFLEEAARVPCHSLLCLCVRVCVHMHTFPHSLFSLSLQGPVLPMSSPQYLSLCPCRRPERHNPHLNAALSPGCRSMEPPLVPHSHTPRRLPRPTPASPGQQRGREGKSWRWGLTAASQPACVLCGAAWTAAGILRHLPAPPPHLVGRAGRQLPCVPPALKLCLPATWVHRVGLSLPFSEPPFP